MFYLSEKGESVILLLPELVLLNKYMYFYFSEEVVHFCHLPI